MYEPESPLLPQVKEVFDSRAERQEMYRRVVVRAFRDAARSHERNAKQLVEERTVLEKELAALGEPPCYRAIKWFRYRRLRAESARLLQRIRAELDSMLDYQKAVNAVQQRRKEDVTEKVRYLICRYNTAIAQVEKNRDQLLFPEIMMGLRYQCARLSLCFDMMEPAS